MTTCVCGSFISETRHLYLPPNQHGAFRLSGHLTRLVVGKRSIDKVAVSELACDVFRLARDERKCTRETQRRRAKAESPRGCAVPIYKGRRERLPHRALLSRKIWPVPSRPLASLPEARLPASSWP